MTRRSPLQSYLLLLLVLGLSGALVGCGDSRRGGNNGDSNGDDDDSADDDDDDEDLCTPQGPENDWWHACEEDLPSGLAGTGFGAGDTAYDFVAQDQFAQDVSLYQFYGKIIVIDAFAQWCGPCQENAPHGQDLWEQGGGEVVMLGAMQQNTGGGAPSSSDAVTWADDFGLQHPVLADSDQFNDSYVVSGYPTYVVIDREMNIVNADLWPFDIDYVLSLL